MKARQQSGGDFKLVPAGMHSAVITGLIDLGLQPGGMYSPAYKVAVIWHTPGALTDDGRPMSITQTYTFSMNKKANLRKHVESLFGKAFPDEKTAADFDLKKILGRPCLINVRHDSKGEKTYANVATVTPLMQGMEAPSFSGDYIYYSEEMPPQEKAAAYEQVPEWLRERIDNQLQPEDSLPAEATATLNGTGGSIEDEGDIPF